MSPFRTPGIVTVMENSHMIQMLQSNILDDSQYAKSVSLQNDPLGILMLS